MPILICGLGSIGRRHLRNLQALGRDDIVLLRTNRSTLPEEDLAGYPVERDIHDTLGRWQIEGVVISNPTSLHLDIAIPAARAGCHLLLEKPVSDSIHGIDELLAAVAHGKSQVVMGFQFRHHPGIRAIKELLLDDVIGRPLYTHAHWGEYLPEWHPWEDYRQSYSARKDLGGGVVLTLCHPFDYLRWFFGDVATVNAELGTPGDLDLEVEDSAEILLTFEDGPLGSVHLDYNQRPPSHRLEIIGTQGTIRWESQNGVVYWWSLDGGDWQEIAPPEGFERNDMFLKEMRHFLDVCAGEAEPICTLTDGIKAMEIALAAKRAAVEGRRISVTKR